MAKVLVTLVVLCVLGSVSMQGILNDKEFMKKTSDCITESGLLNSQNKERSVKCMLSCLMKKYNIMNASGKLAKEPAISLANKILGENAKGIVIFIEKCSKMNVPDDHCDAAFEYMKCAKLEDVVDVMKNSFQR